MTLLTVLVLVVAVSISAVLVALIVRRFFDD